MQSLNLQTEFENFKKQSRVLSNKIDQKLSSYSKIVSQTNFSDTIDEKINENIQICESMEQEIEQLCTEVQVNFEHL